MNQMMPTTDFVAAIPTMTRSEKLLHWASLIRKADPRRPFLIYHRLEHAPRVLLDGMQVDPHDAFSLAARDPILRDAGLGANKDADMVTIGDTMNFFELKQEELHEFSCDCGGAILNDDMARRIENIAHGRSHSGGLGYVREFLRF